MSAIVRPMQQSDIMAMATLRHAAFFDGSERTVAQDAADLEALLRGDGFEAALVAEVDGRPVGTCLFVRQEIDALHDLSPWLAGLVISPDFRRRGLGQALVRAVERHAASVGCARFYLYTDAAEPFYQALGWTVADRLMAEGEPLVLMSCDFGDGSAWPR